METSHDFFVRPRLFLVHPRTYYAMMGIPRASALGHGALCVAVLLLAGRQVHTERELAQLHDSPRRLAAADREGASSGW